MKIIKLKTTLLPTLIYIVCTIGLLVMLNLNILHNDTARMLNNNNQLALFIEKHPEAPLPANSQVLPLETKNSDTQKIAEGAPYALRLTHNTITLTSPFYEEGKIERYLVVSDNRTSATFLNVLVSIFALIIYAMAAFISLNRARRTHEFNQNIVAKIKNIERSPLTQSYLIASDDDQITTALNHLGESIQRQQLSHVEKKENLYEFIEFFQFPIFVYSSKGRIHRANAAFQNDFADTPNLDIFSPYADFLGFLVDKMLHPTMQEKIFYFDRINAYYQVRITPLADLDSRFLVTMLDVTQYKRTLEAHNAFIANVSHEFKTPLTSIIGFADLLENGDLSNADSKKFASIIRDESHRLLDLVQDTLLLTKQNEHIDKKKINLSNLTENILQNFAPQIAQKDLTITTNLSNISQRSNEKMIHSIFENLIENAIKYTEPQGQIIVSLHNAHHKSIFTVTDNGPGLTELQKTRIFDRFYRVDESRAIPGNGLGLAIVEKNVQELHGQIEVLSIPGQGSTFIVTLPDK